MPYTCAYCGEETDEDYGRDLAFPEPLCWPCAEVERSMNPHE